MGPTCSQDTSHGAKPRRCAAFIVRAPGPAVAWAAVSESAVKR